ncbi:lysylphosphatidylglycerol synthase domain-containing protein [Janibacter melonis]|uniref:lysylphosphatidylglycerol synthase domain-containing protein n=1 Tax=Janibacter melonis TaxID=262209 RepID=UPI001918AB17|nr:lysylphosphatidylglycerol synthase domain-containing protein [Janibacter melonis]
MSEPVAPEPGAAEAAASVTEPPPPTTRSTRKRVVDAVRVAFLALVLLAVGYALTRGWDDVSASFRRIGAGSLALGLVLALVSPALTVLGWRVLLADLGSRLHLAPASGVFFVGQLGKYLPGSVWSVVAQADMARRLGVPRRRTAVVGLITIALSALCGIVVGLPALPALLTRGQANLPTWFLVLVVGGLLVALWPPVLNRAIALLFRLLRREPLEHDLSLAAVALSTMWFTLSWLAGGASIWVMATSLADAGADPGHLALVSICGYLLAAGIGMFSFVVPAGVGVRDGVLVVLLATSMPVAAATAVVVVARFYSVVADVAWAGIGWLWARAHHLLPDPKVDTHV